MSQRQWRYWSVRSDAEPSLGGSVLLGILAVFVTYLAVGIAMSPSADNIAGDIILDVVFAALAIWIDRMAIQRAQGILARRK